MPADENNAYGTHVPGLNLYPHEGPTTSISATSNHGWNYYRRRRMEKACRKTAMSYSEEIKQPDRGTIEIKSKPTNKGKKIDQTTPWPNPNIEMHSLAVMSYLGKIQGVRRRRES